jgi:glycosyltransferase involved in cell wall biosynthesis
MNAGFRLGLDGLFLEQPMTGSGEYALQLARHLPDFAGRCSPYLLLPGDSPVLAAGAVRFPAIAGPSPRLPARPRKVFWEQTGLDRAARIAEADLVHVPYFAAPLRQNLPYVVTVHDVIPLALPAYRGSRQMWSYLKLVSRAVRKARLVLTDSRHSAHDIQRFLGIPKQRIRVIPLAVDTFFTPAAGSEVDVSAREVRERFGLQRPFILNIGGFDQRKRLPDLIKGYAAALPRFRESHDLVIAGAPHTDNQALYPPLEPVIQRFQVADRVKLVGFVSQGEKRALYRAASLFAFASAYEGFGLTPLEAMACGTPIVCSNRSSLPEVVGGAGILVEPNPLEIARALELAVNDHELRSELAERGLERARHFSWRRTTEQTMVAYEEALS